MHIHLDFETFSVPKLPEVGSYAYSSHSRAKNLSCAWTSGEDRPLVWTPLKTTIDSPDLHQMLDNIKNGAKLLAWNATFEYDWWNIVMVPQHGWPKLEKRQVFDVQALAMSLALPSDLDTCAKLLGLTELKDERGKKLMNKLSKGKRCLEYSEAPQEYEEYFEYNIQDVVVEREIFKRLERHMYSKFEHETWLSTLYINERGIPVDERSTDSILEVLQKYEKDLTEELNDISGGEIRTANQTAVIKNFCNLRGLDMPDLSAETVKANLDDQILDDPVVYRILEIRQLLARSSVKKFQRIKDMIDEKGRIHSVLRYHNSTTGRWGSSSFQIHNMPRGDIDEPSDVFALINTRDYEKIVAEIPDIKKVCTSLVRPIIKSEPAHWLLIADYVSIEAVIISWIVGHNESLKIVRSGKDIYKWFATLLYNTKYEEVTRDQRAHSKVCLLGLGYQMGAKTFIKSSSNFGIDVSYEEAERNVKLYRGVFKDVKEMWNSLEKAAMYCVRFGQENICGRLSFSLEGDFLRMRLPSGRKISYPFPKIEMVQTSWGSEKLALTCMRRNQKNNKWHRDSISPGTLFENAIQAIGRDILAEAQMRLFKRGYDVLFSVHDEIICHNKISFGGLDEMIEIMCDSNKEFYPGLPIRADGFVTERYQKG